ncbi:MAG TPA: nucleotidyltransferase domain-containing protein [Alphaproteobacteria bacterium]|jgi:predicted nucleotidyltransferase|nr:nucleotidyltransferase domain-containing protein [Alphaproteobacteria bacterium]MDP6270315.1 nucleotidyltransferase domain-containing protein [Alphaproteobacteria bacterium]HJM49567.1 nucleotidyltransferase domain-containing protein [Alphaproteobacteria bacterium]|tara:strand:+ start:273 stop:569 length:297 start_codon:yes stop_codon:yes gene_type:complete
MPERDRIVNRLKAREQELRARGVCRLALIGSTARGEATARDVDVLVDIDPQQPFSLVDHSGLSLYLGDLLECATDVVVRESLSPPERTRIGRDEVSVF